MPELFSPADVQGAIQLAAHKGEACELAYKGLDCAAAEEAAAAAQEARITKLNIYRTKLEDEAVRAMMPRLGGNTVLVELSLGYNHIGDAGAVAIAGMLRQNTTLLRLLLHQNRIEDEGATALAGALCDNGTLDTLSLAANSIGAAGVTAIASTLKDDNFALKQCNLGQNRVQGDETQRGGKAELVRLLDIASCCERNKDPARVAEGLARRQKRRLAAARAEQLRKKREAHAAMEDNHAEQCALAEKMLRLLAPPPPVVAEPEPEPEP